MIGFRLSKGIAGALLASVVMFSAGCSTPFHVSADHVTSGPRSLDIAILVCEPVATLGVVAPGGIQGLSPTVSHALTTALSKASPPIRAVPTSEALNRLTDQGLAREYAELIASYSRSGIPDRARLQQIGTALGSRYVLQPGLAEFSQALVDKFEFAGLKIVRIRVSTLRLWLQLWDTQTGHILSESTGEVTAATPILSSDSTVSLDAIAQTLWSRMIEKDLLEGTNESWRCPETGRKLLDGKPLLADSRPHRATRVAPHVIESRTLGPGTMRGGERSNGGVPEQDRQGDETHRHGATDGPCVASMTSRNVPERMNELNDRAGGSVEVVKRAAIGPYRRTPPRGDRV